MIRLLEQFYSQMIHNTENFKSNPESRLTNVLPMLLAVITVEILLLVLGKFLWNNYLVKSIAVINPVESIVEIFAISLLLRLLLT